MRLKPAIAGSILVNLQSLPDVDAKLVIAQTGRDVGMSLGKDVGIDAQGETSLASELCGALSQQLQLRLALSVEFENVSLERQVNLGGSFAHAGVDDPDCGLGRSRQHPLQLSAGDDVESRSMRRQQLQNSQSGVGLDRVADQMSPAGQR